MFHRQTGNRQFTVAVTVSCYEVAPCLFTEADVCALAFVLTCLLSRQAGGFNRNFCGKSFMYLVEEGLSYWSDHLGKCNSRVFYIDTQINNNNVHFSLKYLSFASICDVVSKADFIKLLCSST